MAVFQINVTLEHGQLHESLDLEADRQEMIARLDKILSDTSPGSLDLRDGVIQILIDQLRTNNGHEPLIIRTGDEIVWQSKIEDGNGNNIPIVVNVARYPQRPPVQGPQGPRPRTPHRGALHHPFNIGNGGTRVPSGPYVNFQDATKQKFYKFTISGTDPLGNPLTLDPCIICDR